MHLLYQEVLRLREEIAAKVAERDEEVGQLREALRRQVERVTAMACAEEIVRRAGRQLGAAANSGPVPVQRPEVNSNRPKREPPAGWRVINGGLGAVVPVVLGAAALAVVLLVIAGGALAVPGMLTGHSAQAATRPHPHLLFDPSHWVSASPPPVSAAASQAAEHKRCRQDADSDVVMVLLADHRKCKDRDAPQDAAQPAALPAAPAVKGKEGKKKGKAPPPQGSAAPSPLPTIIPSPGPTVTPEPVPAPTPTPDPSCTPAGKSHHCRHDGSDGTVPTVAPSVPPAETPSPGETIDT